MHDNEKILTGYRINFNTIRKISRTIFMVHNETVNVWTHLIGVVFFILLITYTYIYMAPHSKAGSLWYPDLNHTRKMDSELLGMHIG